MKWTTSLIWLAAIALLAQGVCAAANLTVDTTADTHSVGFSSQALPNSTVSTDNSGHTSLRSAMEYASTRTGTWVINLPSGTYNLSLGDLVVGVNPNTTITVQGQGTAANTTINQTQTHRMVFLVNYNVDPNVVFNLVNVTLSGGDENSSDPDGFGGNGGAILAGGSDTASGNVVGLTNVVFSGNSANGNANGGAISMTGGGSLIIAGCTFTGNYAGASAGGSGAGGAIYFDAGFNPGNVSITNSTFTGNIASGAEGLGGAVYLAGDNAGGNTFTIEQCAFTGNKAAVRGGAIDLESGHLSANFNRITGNTAPASSGNGLYVLSSGGGWADARNNWWGGNLGPNGTGGDSVVTTASSAPSSTTPPLAGGQVSFSPWITLANTASPPGISANGSTTMTASFLQNSSSQTLTANQVWALVGAPVTWNGAVHGGFSSQQTTIQANGEATAGFTNDGTCNDGSGNAVVDNATVTADVTVACPDLTVSQSDNTSGTAALGSSWTWTFHVANPGTGTAIFANGNTILTDNLPDANINFGSPSIANASGLTGNVTLSVDGSGNLTGVADGAAQLASGGSFDVQITATPAAAGTFTNPRASGTCQVNSIPGIAESNEANDSANADSVVVNKASPAISTAQQPASATVGAPIADKATVTGGDNPTGTVTFNLYNNPTATGTPLFTDTETLVSGSATSAGFTTTATGTFYWVATYNGDANNSSVSSGTASEPVTITAASPGISTAQQPASAAVGSTIADKATVTGGDNPTGTVTFNLYNNPTGTGTPLFTATETLSGGTATSPGYATTTTGTFYWVATYNGDSKNNSVTSGTASEPVTVTPATPTINTAQQPASATVGSTIADKATVTGGDNPTGTVTFNLYNNPTGIGTPLFTATETLSGGTATSPGYTTTATGTYYWVATYNGDANNSSVTTGTASEPVTVTSITVTIFSGLTANIKSYDGTTAATLSSNNVVLAGVLAGDAGNVALSTNGYTATFASASIGTAISVTVSGLSLTGTASGNYSLTQPTLSANITAAAVTITSGLTANNKIYDGTTSATLSSNNVVLAGVAAGDAGDVALSTNDYAAAFESAAAGLGKNVIVSGLSLTGSAAGNYSLIQPTPAASITSRAITVTAVVNTKVYDGTTAAAAIPAITSGTLAAGDTANFTETYDTAQVGSGKPLIPSGSVSGGNGGNNYTVTFVENLTGMITPQLLSVSGIMANDKVYDGTTTASLSSNNVVLGGVVAGDTGNVALSTNGYIATFASAAVGTGKSVTVTGLSFTGGAAGNYLMILSPLTANVAPAPVTITSGLAVNNKNYDGTTAAMLSSNNVVLAGVLAGDAGNVALSTNGYTAAFAGAAAGAATSVSVIGLSLTGTAAGNYSLTPPSLSGDIGAAPVAITAGLVANNKVYDGTTLATLSSNGVVLAGVLAGDAGDVALSTNGYTATFASAAAGAAISVSVGGLSLSGNAAGNYSLTDPMLSANIAAAGVTITSGLTANNKVYDGTAAATISSNNVVLAGVAAGDAGNVVLSTNGYYAAFAGPTPGTGKSVTVQGLSLTGSAGGNYLLAPPLLSADITAAPLLAQADNQTRAYGQTNPVWAVSYSGFLSGDNAGSLGGSLSFTFTDTNGVSVPSIQTNTTVGTYVIIPGGLTSTNYALTYANGTLQITQAVLTVAANPATKVYGAANPALTATMTGFVNGEGPGVISGSPLLSTAVGVSSPAGTYDIVTGLGTLSATNYSFSLEDGLLTVTPAPLTAVADNQSRIYGAANPPLTIHYEGFVNGDDAGALSPAPAAGTLAGPGSGVGQYAITLSGGSATNYTLSLVDGTLAVTPAPLSIVAGNASRPYGQTNPIFTGTITGLMNQDAITATYACAAQTNSPAGAYSITPTVAGSPGLLSNYSVTLANGTLTVTAALLLNPTPETVLVGQGPTLLDPAASVADGGSLNFGGGTLIVQVVTNASTEDSLVVEPPGTNSNLLGVADGSVTWGGATLATFQGGTGSNALAFSLTTNATSASLTALLRQVAFATGDTNSGTRVVAVTLTYGDITVTTNRMLLLDRPPVANEADIWATAAPSITIPISQLLAFDTDPDGDSLSLVGFSPLSALGGQVSQAGTNLVYQPPSLTIAEDVLSYVVGDGRGGEADGTVRVHLLANGQFQIYLLQPPGNAGVQILFAGTPGHTYQIQASADLMHWAALETITTAQTGVVVILDPAAA